jgi:hypothetical protein
MTAFRTATHIAGQDEFRENRGVPGSVLDDDRSEGMIDTSTGERLQVSTEAESGPYIDLPFSQVDEVRKRLDREGIPYWVDPDVISFDDGPEMAEINFSRYVDAARVQAVLDQDV